MIGVCAFCSESSLVCRKCTNSACGFVFCNSCSVFYCPRCRSVGDAGGLFGPSQSPAASKGAGSTPTQPSDTGTRKDAGPPCPHCGAAMPSDAVSKRYTRCRHCQGEIKWSGSKPVASTAESVEDKQFKQQRQQRVAADREQQRRYLRQMATEQFGPTAASILFDRQQDARGSKEPAIAWHEFAHEESRVLRLSISGAIRLVEFMPPPYRRVVVTDDSAKFNRQGKTVFSKFVLGGDHEISAGGEVIVVDQYDAVCAVGRATKSLSEMLGTREGVAVEVRQGARSK